MHKLLTLSNLNDITEPNKTIIIKVGADWCGPCKLLKPMLMAEAENYIGKV